jgi:hypothetical protein
LVDGVADGFAELAFGQDGSPECELVEGLLEPLVDHVALDGADGLAQIGSGLSGLGFSQALFNVIEMDALARIQPTSRGDCSVASKNFTLTRDRWR